MSGPDVDGPPSGPLARLCLAAFDALIRLWPADERAEFGSSMRAMLESRLRERRGSIGARLVRAARELSSVAWQGVAARSRHRAGRGPGLGSWTLDVRYALRSLVRRPRFSLLVFATLALGLGLAVSAFAVIEATVLRPLPFPEGDRLVGLWSGRNGAPTPWGNLSWLDLMDLRAGATTFAAMGGHTTPSTAAVAGRDRPSLATVIEVTPGFFETLQLRPERGRLLQPADQESADVALISHAAWVSRFGADPDVIGAIVTVDDRPVRIVGVLPPAARFYPAADVALWLPYAPADQSRGSRNLVVVGRLARAGGLEEAGAEIRTLMAGLAAAYPDSDEGLSAQVRPLAEQMMGAEVPHVLRLLLAATLAILLLATANVAGLVLARAQERSAELAVLVSLGASRLRLLRPLLLESLVLAVAGGGAAIAMARWLPAAVLAHAPLTVPRAAEVRLDGLVLLSAVVGTLVVAALASVAPAWSVVDRTLHASLGGGRGSSPARSALRAREGLVVAQVAGALVLLTAAGLTIRSLEKLTAVDPGFDATRVAEVSLRLERARYPHAEDLFGFQDALVATLSGLGGVERVAAVSMVPFGGGGLCDAFGPDGADPVSDCVQYRSVTPGYFAAMGIPLVQGRDVDAEDGGDAPLVAVLSRSAAALAFPQADALGRIVAGRGERWRVVGVVEDSRLADLAGDVPAAVYLPFRQAPFRLVTAVVRARDPRAVASALPGAVWSVDPQLAVRDARTLAELVSGSASAHRFRGLLFGGAGAVGLFVAMLGVAGLLLQLVSQRRREIGVRMALGSTRSAVVRSVLARALLPTAMGIVLGLGGSLLTGRVLAGFLFGVSAFDPATLALAATALLLAALLAAVVPARNAAAVDPVHTLRAE